MVRSDKERSFRWPGFTGLSGQLTANNRHPIVFNDLLRIRLRAGSLRIKSDKC